jgi:hypothetical protein
MLEVLLINMAEAGKYNLKGEANLRMAALFLNKT